VHDEARWTRVCRTCTGLQRGYSGVKTRSAFLAAHVRSDLCTRANEEKFFNFTKKEKHRKMHGGLESSDYLPSILYKLRLPPIHTILVRTQVRKAVRALPRFWIGGSC